MNYQKTVDEFSAKKVIGGDDRVVALVLLGAMSVGPKKKAIHDATGVSYRDMQEPFDLFERNGVFMDGKVCVDHIGQDEATDTDKHWEFITLIAVGRGFLERKNKPRRKRRSGKVGAL